MVGIVHQPIDTFGSGAMGAAVDFSVGLSSMPENPGSAALTHRSDRMNRTLKGIKSVGLSAYYDVEAFVIGISAVVAGFHSSGEFADDVPPCIINRCRGFGNPQVQITPNWMSFRCIWQLCGLADRWEFNR